MSKDFRAYLDKIDMLFLEHNLLKSEEKLLKRAVARKEAFMKLSVKFYENTDIKAYPNML